MCRTEGEIMLDDPIIQDIDEHIARNHLDPLDKLMLRVMKHNYAKSIQIEESVGEFSADFLKHVDDKECHTPKGIILRGPVIVWAIFIMILISTVITYLPEHVGVLIP